MISTINYNGISNEDIFQACFMVEGSKEVFLIHEFIKEKKCDYVVIGKLKNNSKTNLSGVNYLDWVINVNKAIKNYKYKSQPNSIIIEKILTSPISKEIQFTLEGYDLITNKFKYLNNKINRTVNLRIKEINQKILYEPPQRVVEEDFYDLDFLNKNFFFTSFEFSQLEFVNFLEYVQENLSKVNSYVKNDSSFLMAMSKITVPSDKINYIMKYISSKPIEQKVDSLKTYR